MEPVNDVADLLEAVKAQKCFCIYDDTIGGHWRGVGCVCTEPLRSIRELVIKLAESKR